MDFIMTVRHPCKGDEWEETVKDATGDNAQEIGQRIIDGWNNTLRPHDKIRELVSVKVLGEKVVFAHQWGKSNLVTLMKPRPHDTHKCSKCGVTGKTFRLGDDIKRDARYKAAKYDHCTH